MRSIDIPKNAGFSLLSLMISTAVIGIVFAVVSDAYLSTRRMHALSTKIISLDMALNRLHFMLSTEELCSKFSFVNNALFSMAPTEYNKVVRTESNLFYDVAGVSTPFFSTEELESMEITSIEFIQRSKDFNAWESGHPNYRYPNSPPSSPEDPQYIVEIRVNFDESNLKKLFSRHSESKTFRTIFLLVEANSSNGFINRCHSAVSITQVCRVFGKTTDFGVFPPCQ